MLNRGLILIILSCCYGCTSMLVGGSPGGSADRRSTTRSEASVGADAEISAAVRSKLGADGYTSGAAISVSTYEGRVTLRGVVASYGAREQAGRVAGSIAGVVRVNNELTVKPQQ